MKEELEALADQLRDVGDRVGDLVFQALRAQHRDSTDGTSKEFERELSRVRRSIDKAEHLLRGIDPPS